MRFLGVALCLIGLVDGLGAACTAGGCTSPLARLLFAAGVGDHAHCPYCEHRAGGLPAHSDDPSGAQEGEDHDPAPPLHLCSTSHAMYVPPSAVASPDPFASAAAWFDRADAFILLSAPASETEAAPPCLLRAARDAGRLRALLQVFLI